MSDRAPTLSQVIRAAIERGVKQVRVSMPGRIESFDAETQTATVQPLLRDVDDDREGNQVVTQLAQLTKVPVVVEGGNGFMITFPVVKGDPVLLHFTDSSLDSWHETGNDADPGDLRTHSITDAVAVLGLRSKPGALTEFDGARAVFGKQGGVRIAVDGNVVHLGVAHNEAATEAAVLGNARTTAESTFLGQLSTGFTQLVTAFTQVTVNIPLAAGLNAIPIVGGALAAPFFVLTATAVGQAVAAFGTMTTAVTTFSSKLNTFLSAKVKIK